MNLRRTLSATGFCLFAVLCMVHCCGCGATPREQVANADRLFLATVTTIDAQHDAKLISDETLVRLRPYINAAEAARKRLRTEWLAVETGGDPNLFNAALDVLEAALAAIAAEQARGDR